MSEFQSLIALSEANGPLDRDALLPALYDELRRLAAARLAQEVPGHTLQATALVHEAYLRLVGDDPHREWESYRHFFAAAAEAMRRILIERARRRACVKNGGNYRRLDIDEQLILDDQRGDQLIALDEALVELERHDPQLAELVKLRYFAGLGHQDAARAIGMNRRTADRLWLLAKAWLYKYMSSDS